MGAAGDRVLVDAKLRSEDAGDEVVRRRWVGRGGDDDDIGIQTSESGDLRVQLADRTLVRDACQ